MGNHDELFRSLVPCPVLEDNEIAEMHFRIYDSVTYDYALKISYWEPIYGKLGVISTVKGAVKQLDAINKKIKLADKDEDFIWIKLDSITSISK
ncbi:YolD-like family protein [Brevibacillus sp. SYSU BS000544]|uniref:YolD-like family protein n=1 Tax=Brevibacillus sp. SYSU BS000544 TaxID=3416443 RepID=UPI003CE588BC